MASVPAAAGSRYCRTPPGRTASCRASPPGGPVALARAARSRHVRHTVPAERLPRCWRGTAESARDHSHAWPCLGRASGRVAYAICREWSLRRQPTTLTPRVLPSSNHMCPYPRDMSIVHVSVSVECHLIEQLLHSRGCAHRVERILRIAKFGVITRDFLKDPLDVGRAPRPP